MEGQVDRQFVSDIEQRYFRTNEDVGANHNALFIWNQVRDRLGMSMIAQSDLPAYCSTHETYHKILDDYGCIRGKK